MHTKIVPVGDFQRSILFFYSLILCFHHLNQPVFSQSSTYEPTWESIDSRPVPNWFENAKFGIFIHWGLYSVPAYSPASRDAVGKHGRYAEWYWKRLLHPSKLQPFFQNFHKKLYGPSFSYKDFAPLFKAELFNPDEWAAMFKSAGAKYVVLTSKHHEGYTLWPSKQSPGWNAVDVGPKYDLFANLTEAVKKAGLKMGAYYSLLEWYNPLYRWKTMDQYVEKHMFPQIKDLISTYKPELLYTDGEWEMPSKLFQSPAILSWLFNESPVKDTIVINDRWGKETRGRHGGYYTTEYGFVHKEDVRNQAFTRPWEECRGISASFGYNRHENLEDYSTSKELIFILINKVALGITYFFSNI